MSEVKVNPETLDCHVTDYNNTDNKNCITNFQDNTNLSDDKKTHKNLQTFICKSENHFNNLSSGIPKFGMLNTETKKQHVPPPVSRSSSGYLNEEEENVNGCTSEVESGSVSSIEMWFDAEGTNDKTSVNEDLAYNSCHSDDFVTASRDFIYNNNPGRFDVVNSTFNDIESSNEGNEVNTDISSSCSLNFQSADQYFADLVENSHHNEGNDFNTNLSSSSILNFESVDQISTDLVENLNHNERNVFNTNLSSPCILNFESADKNSVDQACVKSTEESDGIGVHNTHCDTSLSSTLGSINEINNSDQLDLTMKASQHIEDVDYICTTCNKEITIFNKDFELSRRRHFEDFHSGSEVITTIEDKMLANNIFFSKVIESLPKNLRVHEPFLYFDINTIFCKLCNCSLEIVKDSVKSTSFSIKKHLIHQYHKHQHDLMSKEVMEVHEKTPKQNNGKLNTILPTVNSTGVGKSFLTSEKSAITSIEKNQSDEIKKSHNNCKLKNSSSAGSGLTDKDSSTSGLLDSKIKGNSMVDQVVITVKKMVPTLQDHWKFITRYDSNFLCNLCGRGITYSPNPSTLAKNFKCHLKLKEHTDYIRQVTDAVSPHTSKPVSPTNKNDSPNPESSQIYERLKRVGHMNNLIKANMRFITCDGIHFKCNLCYAKILNSPVDSTLAENFICHFKGKNHTYNFDEEGRKSKPQDMVKSQPNSRIADDVPKSNTCTDPLLMEMLKLVPPLKDNLKYISRPSTHFHCSLCGKGITYSLCHSTLAKNFQLHFKNHRAFSSILYPQNSQNKIPSQNRNLTNKEVPSSSTNGFNFNSSLKSKHPSQSINRLRNVASKCSIVKLNTHYIGYSGINFRCTLCDVTIINSPVNTTLAENFTSHFSGYYHTAKLNELY